MMRVSIPMGTRTHMRICISYFVVSVTITITIRATCIASPEYYPISSTHLYPLVPR